jgi:hypothetical protein
MGNGSVGGTNPFQGALWNEARGMIQHNPRGLTDAQLLTLVDHATADTNVTPQEQQLLRAVADPANVRQIAQAIRTHGSRAGFDVQGLNFNTTRSQQIQQNLDVGTAGQQIGNTYDTTAEARQRNIQQSAASTHVGPGQRLTMSTDAGRDAILDAYGQLAGSSVYGYQACGAASLVALAVNAGPQGLGALAHIVRNDRSYDPSFAQLCDRMSQPDPQITLADLATLQDALLERMQIDQNNRDTAAGTSTGQETQGLRPDSLIHFMRDHQSELRPLFAGGGGIIGIDNSGDGLLDHFVANVRRHGQDRVFEPYQPQSGHHLITDAAQIARYAQARTN